jgi:iron complex transport system permease protein
VIAVPTEPALIGAQHAPRHRAVSVALFLLALLGGSVVLSLGSGALPIPFGMTLHVLARGVSGHARHLDGLEAVVWDLRVPRVLTGVLVGGSLGASGAAMQGLFRNPLADPYLLGVASGASLGATVAWVLLGTLGPAFGEVPFVPSHASTLVPLLAFVGATLAVVATVTLAGTGARPRPTSLLLAGVVIGSILTALSTYLLLRDEDRIRAVFAWSLGNLSFAGWRGFASAAPYAIVGFAVLMLFARSLDAMQLGDDTATTLGVNVGRVQLAVIAGASLSTAASVAFVGLVGFVGLIAPHVMRRLGPTDHRTLVLTSALAGAVILVFADLLARTVARPAELPVGIVMTLLGGPFFLWLLRRTA